MMEQEQKQILLEDLCARLPYGVKGLRDYSDEVVTLHFIIPNCKRPNEKTGFIELEFTNLDCCPINKFKPYLRPMTSMTEEEKKVYKEFSSHLCGEIVAYHLLKYLNAHHLDYRGLIPMGLALEAKEGMYIIKKQ